MPTSPLDQLGRATQTHSTELIRDPFSYPYALDQRGQLFLTDNQLAITCGSAPYNTCSLPSMTDALD